MSNLLSSVWIVDTLRHAMASTPQTALERALAGEAGQARATPLDALRAARRMWLAEQRIDMGGLATALGISRATLYHWVGDRERLTAEVIWSMAERTIADGREQARGSGADYLSDVIGHYLAVTAQFEPTRRFIERDPEFALRVLTSRQTPFQSRLTDTVRGLIEEQVKVASYEPPLDPETLSYVLVRIGESFIFNDLITGSDPDLEKAVQASRVLLHAKPIKN
jgi:AcrR family transcriptional regulator